MRRTFNDVATLAARMGVGGIFFANGWHKLEAGLTATGQSFSAQGAPAPGVWAAATMLIELLGGALLIAGLAVPVCGILLFIEALAVFAIASGDQSLPLTGGDTNLIVALGAASILLSVVGGGRLSVDHMVVIRRRDAEDAENFAADTEAEAVISSLREPRRGLGSKDTDPKIADLREAEPRDSGVKGSIVKDTAPGGTAAKGGMTGSRDPSDEGPASDSPSRPRKTRPRRTDPGSGTTASRSEAPAAEKGDKLVASRRESPGRA